MLRPVVWQAVRGLVCAAGAALMVPSAMADWLDDMPSVGAVAKAVQDEIQESKNPGFIGDPDHLATRLAGTFVLLRWFMLFEALREANPSTAPGQTQPLREPNMSAPRRARMDAIATEYRQVELAIERGLGKRNGVIKKHCDHKGTDLNRFGQKMYTLAECYRRRYEGGVDNAHIAFDYRRAIFPRLFCNNGLLYHERYQEYFRDGDGYRPPAQRVMRPHNYAFVVAKQWPAFAQPMTTAAVCAAHGGDANGDGLCDAWLAAPRGGGTTACVPKPEPITVLKLRQVDAVTVRVEFSATKIVALPTQLPVFALGRLDKVNQVGTAIASTTVVPAPVSSDPATQIALLRTLPGALDVDPIKPNLGVRAGSNGEFGGAWCRQSTPVPALAEFRADLAAGLLGGLYGPYDTAHGAASAIEEPARTLGEGATTWYGSFREAVGYIVRDMRSQKAQYYATLPALGPYTNTTNVFSPEPPMAGPEDRKRSLAASFGSSCRDQADFSTFAVYHTHPTYQSWNNRNNNFFSGGDWQNFLPIRQELQWPSLQSAAPVAGNREGFYLFRPDRCIDFTDGRSNATSVGSLVNNQRHPCAPDSKCRVRPDSSECK